MGGDTYFHTECHGNKNYWTASFDGLWKVEKVKIMNRPLSTDSETNGRLAGAIITIDGQRCGVIPNTATGGKLYEVTCSTPIVGSTINIQG